MKTKCIWSGAIAVLALCLTMATAGAAGPANLGQGYISNVTGAGSNCVFSDTNGGGIQFWDIKAGGTYTITLSNVIDCDQGQDSQIGVIVHNSTGGNVYTLANQLSVGVYQFTVTLVGSVGTQCLTMPIEYCTTSAIGVPANKPGSGFFAQDFNGTGGGGHAGHLRTATFDDNCNLTGLDTTCSGITCDPSSIQVTKFYDSNGNGTKDTGENGLANWPFCLTSVTDPDFAPVTQYTGAGGTTTFSNLGPGTYIVTEGTGDGTWQNSTSQSTITIDHCGQNATAVFGNFCTTPSGGLTLGFWSNKNGNKILTGNASGTGTTLLPGVVTLLNSFCAVNADGSSHNFTNSYSAFRTWLLGATATNMAYMLSAQLAAMELNVNYGVPPNKVDKTAFDLCSHMTIDNLMTDAKNLLCGPGGNLTLAGSPIRGSEQVDKDCIDALNNNGPVIPSTPCSVTFSTFTCP